MRIFILIIFFICCPFFAYPQDGTYDGLKLKATLGLIPEWKESRKFGYNTTIDTATVPEDVWSGGGVYSFPTSAATTTIVSSDVADDVGGTGCFQVRVEGLDSAYAEAIEEIYLDGTTNATFSTQFLRINRASCIASGSSMGNVGTIDIKHGATIIGQMPIGDGQTQQVVYTVPAGFYWLLDRFSSSVLRKQASSVVVVMQIKVFGTNTWRTILSSGLVSSGSSVTTLNRPENRPFVLDQKTDVRVRVTYSDANGVEVNANISGFLVQKENNPYF